jgi:arylsulfatase
MRTSVWPDGGFQGPYRGDIGSAKEGSIRTAGMIKWPGHIEPGVVHGMFSTMDFFPTLANFAGANVPKDRPIDGMNQAAFLLNYKPPTTEGKNWNHCRNICQSGLPHKISPKKVCQITEKSSQASKLDIIHQKVCGKCPSGETARDNLLTFINGKLTAIRWKQFRIYFTSLLPQEGFMAIEGSSSMNVPNLNPLVYNIERDPRELVDTRIYNAWAISRAMPYVGEYVNSLKDSPNPTASYPGMLPLEILIKEYLDKAGVGK